MCVSVYVLVNGFITYTFVCCGDVCSDVGHGLVTAGVSTCLACDVVAHALCLCSGVVTAGKGLPGAKVQGPCVLYGAAVW